MRMISVWLRVFTGRPRALGGVTTYLHEAVANETHQQLLAPPLFDQRGVLSAVHAREVKHGHVRLA